MPVLLATLFVIGAGELWSTTSVPVTDDEGWFLCVVERCRLGERLYRDVFYGAGPLPVWVALAAVRSTRPQLLVLRVLSVGMFLTTLVAVAVGLDRVGASTLEILAAWSLMVGVSGPARGIDNLYGQAAIAAAGVGLAAAAAGAAPGAPGAAAVAGAAAAACTMSKHSIGGPVLVLTASATAVTSGAVGVAAYAAAFAAVAVLCLLPLHRDGVRWLWRRAVANKSTYLATGSVGPVAGLREALETAEGGARPVATGTFALLGVGCAAAPAALAWPSADSHAALLAAGAATVAAAAAFPRADLPHLRALAPLATCAVVAALTSVVHTPAASWLAGVLLVLGALAAGEAMAPRRRRSVTGPGFDFDVPHFRRLPVARAVPGGRRADGWSDAVEATGGVVFLLRPDAALWYLAADLRNPTPFDYPYASVFGPDGEDETIEGIRRGAIPWVCVGTPMIGRLAPVTLQRFVFAEMVPAFECPAGTVYRIPGH